MFFDGVVFIIGFVLLGNYLELSPNYEQLTQCSLMTLQPNLTRVVKDDYTEMIATTAVGPHSLIKVLTGETIPIDGVLENCKASIGNQP